jgi:glycerol-3-phosphate dehydrogenase (NAD(P)+)
VLTYEEAMERCELAVLVTPSHVVREVVEGLKAYLRPGIPVVSAAKGIENQTLMTVSQVVADVIPEMDPGAFGCIAGPSFAREVALGYPTAVTVACRDQDLARRLQGVFYTESFRVYASGDVIGTELGGALKNVIAIGAGVADGLGFGHNARAALITRGLAEITRLAVSMGALPLTLAGLAGIGDLVLTCTGELSRNRTVGLKIGQGMSLEEIQSGMDMVAEGVRTALSAHELGKREGVDLPITDQVYEILYRGKEPRDAVRELMTRELKMELEY